MARAKRRKWDDGYYHANVTIGRDPETGKPIRKFLKARTQTELDRKIEKVKATQYTDDGKAQATITFNAYAKKWFELTKSSKASNTKLQYSNVLRNHCNIIGDMPLDAIKKSDILLQLQESQGHYSTQEIMLTCFKQVFNCASDDEIILRNPAANVKLDQEPTRNKRRQLTAFELDCFKKADLTLQQRTYLSLLLYTGCRKGEVLALTKTDINLRKKTISVNKALKHIVSTIEVSEPKSQAGFREIPIFDPLFPVLKAYLKSLDTEYLFTGSKDESGKPNPMTKWEAQKMWNSIYEQASSVARSEIQSGNAPDIISLDDPLQGLTPHYFRHNMTTVLYYSGVDIKDAARLLGHANVNVTLEVYTHLDKEKQAENVQSVNRYLSGL